MMKEKAVRVFLTGATGHMGSETLKRLARDRRVQLKLLVLPDRNSRKSVAPYRHEDNVEVLYGDLRNPADVERGVAGANFVLHLGALIPPAADRNPGLTEEINLGGTLNILRAIKAQPDPSRVRMVYISTVASMGNRQAPVHWGRTGDPVMVSRFDAYTVSKVKAERAVMESGLPYWVSIRQSGMLHKDLLGMMDPILFHQPLDNRIEWSTAEDSGRALYNLCTDDLPDSFWRQVYNLSSGAEFRVTYYDFLKQVYASMGVKHIERIYSPRDFALKNFHCVWYRDADRLDEWLHFRESRKKTFRELLQLPFYTRLLKLIPSGLIRRLFIKPLTEKEEGTRHWLESDNEEKIRAYWGSREKWEAIPEDWSDFHIEPDPPVQEISHGFDETLPDSGISSEQCREAARFRGGELESSEMSPGDVYRSLLWRCAEGHHFSASPYLVLRGGHWCPQCDTDVDHYERQALSNRFFAQVYYPEKKEMAGVLPLTGSPCIRC